MRLRKLRDGVHRLPSQVGYLVAGPSSHDRARKMANPLRALYGTARWQRLRWSVLEAELFTCRMCGGSHNDTSKLVADHIRPHRGDLDLFWDRSNLQCLCKGCHDSVKQREEAAGGRERAGGGGV